MDVNDVKRPISRGKVPARFSDGRESEEIASLEHPTPCHEQYDSSNIKSVTDNHLIPSVAKKIVARAYRSKIVISSSQPTTSKSPRVH